ncbi:MAG: alpha/beta fold hydrolase [Aureispira sp.]
MATLKELLPRYTDQDSRFLVIEDSFLHYKDVGQGPVLVLLHGAFSSLHTYDAWATNLEQHYRVVRLDLMGFGLTGAKNSNDYSMKNQLRVLKEFLDRLEIDRCTLVGSSLGGWISWEFAYAHPNRINKLILINSAGFLEEDAIPLPFKLAQSRLAPHLLKYIIRRSVLELFVKQVFFDSKKATEAVVTRYFDLFTREGNSEALLHLVNAPFLDHSSYLTTIQQPTLILWGAEDAWIPVAHAYRFRDSMPNAQLIIYPKVGHIPMEEVPERSLADVLHFLALPAT